MRRAPLRVRQFRASEEDVERWRVIRLPFGQNDFSAIIRHALNELYRQLVTSVVRKPGEFVAVRYKRCAGCQQPARVNSVERCLPCEMRYQSQNKIVTGGDLVATPGKVTANGRPRKARGAPPAKAKQPRKGRKGGE